MQQQQPGQPLSRGSAAGGSRLGSPDRRGRGRPSFADLLERDGPNSLVILIGAPEGRWAAELTMQAPECQDAAAAMMRALSWTTLAQPEQPAVPLAVGVAVVGSWRFVRGTASSDATYHLMAAAHAAMSQGRRRGADNSFRFIEHMVSASAILADNDMHLGIPGHSFRPDDIHLQATPAHVLDTLRGQRVRVTHGPVTYAGGYQPTIEELVTQWSWTFGVGHLREATLWAAWTPVANALAAGVWGGDVSPLAAKSRQGSLRSLGNPGPSPSERLLRAFMNPGGGTAVPQPPPWGRVVAAAAAAAASRRNTWDTHGRPRGFLRPFNPVHLLNAVRAAQDVADQGKMDRTAQNSLRYWYPLDWEQRKAERCSQGFTPPQMRSPCGQPAADSTWLPRSCAVGGIQPMGQPTAIWASTPVRSALVWRSWPSWSASSSARTPTACSLVRSHL